MLLVPQQTSHIMQLDTQAVFGSCCWSTGRKSTVPIHFIFKINVTVFHELFLGCPKVLLLIW